MDFGDRGQGPNRKPSMREVWVYFLWNNPLVEKQNLTHHTVDFCCMGLCTFLPLSSSDIGLFMVNSDWLTTHNTTLIERCFLDVLATP